MDHGKTQLKMDLLLSAERREVHKNAESYPRQEKATGVQGDSSLKWGAHDRRERKRGNSRTHTCNQKVEQPILSRARKAPYFAAWERLRYSD